MNHKVRRGSDGNEPSSAERLKLPEVKVQFENIILDVCGHQIMEFVAAVVTHQVGIFTWCTPIM